MALAAVATALGELTSARRSGRRPHTGEAARLQPGPLHLGAIRPDARQDLPAPRAVQPKCIVQGPW